jgi:O-antigen ligase
MNKAVQSRIITVLYVVLVWAVSFLFIDENLGRSMFIGSFALIFLMLSYLLRSPVVSSLLVLFLVFPFNITYALSASSFNFDPYVGGVYLNYLVPTLSIIDLFGLLAIFALIIDIGLGKISITVKCIILILLIYLIVHNIIVKDWVTVILSFRVVILASVGLLIVQWIDSNIEYLRNYESRIRASFVVILGGLVLFQGGLGYLQFSRGATYHMSALGESFISTSLPNASYIDLDGSLYLRAYGTFPHPNLLAGFLFLSFILFSIFLKTKWKYNKIIWVPLLVILFLTMFTFSRSVIFLMIIFVLTLICIELFQLWRNRKKGIQINEIALTPFGMVIERFRLLIDGGDVSISERIGLLEASIRVVLEKPLLGVGFGQFVRNMVPYAPQTNSGFTLLQPVHNIYLLILAEHGVIAGSVIIISIIGYCISTIFRSKRIVISIMSASFIVIIGSVDHYLVSLPQGMFILLSLLLILKIVTYSYFEEKSS